MSSILSIRLKALRRQHDENQEQAAQFMGVTRSAYSSYERGINVPPYAKLKLIGDHYGVSIDYLMGHTNNKEPIAATPKERGIIDIYDELNKISELLMDETSAVQCKGEMLGENEKSLLLPFVNSVIKFIEIAAKIEEGK